MPCAMTRSALASPTGSPSIGANMHCTRADTPEFSTRSMAASNIGCERSVPMTDHPISASGTAFRAAPQPMSTAVPWPPIRSSSARAKAIRTSLGDAVEKPDTVPGALHGVPARGSMVRLALFRSLVETGCCSRDEYARACLVRVVRDHRTIPGMWGMRQQATDSLR